MTTHPSNSGVGPTDQVVTVAGPSSQNVVDKHGPIPIVRIAIALVFAVPESLVCAFIMSFLNPAAPVESVVDHLRSNLFWPTFWTAFIPCSIASLLIPEIFMATWYFSLKRLRELRMAMRIK